MNYYYNVLGSNLLHKYMPRYNYTHLYRNYYKSDRFRPDLQPKLVYRGIY